MTIASQEDSSVDLPRRRRERFRRFCSGGGKFRVAVVNTCNLSCFFCHNEAMPNPRAGDVAVSPHDKSDNNLDDDALIGLINAYIRLGGPSVNITGGEPLAHSDLPGFLARIDKGTARIVLNTNAVLAERLLDRPPLESIDQILASLHTMDDTQFRESLGGKRLSRVTENIVALACHGYDVCINYSLGPYNRDEFPEVLAFALAHRIRLKAIALVRPNDSADFYGGRWVDPKWLSDLVTSRGGKRVGKRTRFGGQVTQYDVDGVTVEVKNVAVGRLATDFCVGCQHLAECGEGIYGLRVGVDGIFKPCLLRRERFAPVRKGDPFEPQILDAIGEMVGDWDNATFLSGAPN